MPSPVKVSDRLLALAKAEAQSAHRSATAQIEHWATLGRAIEVMVAYRDVLALKRAGQALPIPTFARRDEVHRLLARLVEDGDRESIKARIRAAGTPLYATDPGHPGRIVEVHPDGTRTRGYLKRRRFMPAGGKSTRRK
ncbi:MAG TPA: hypothetical protein VGW35_12725 [Methylomirabilota bacterium]|jgi:hypothetical protein|nr:hypothetical protein [Methylomirabilota bacterium]HEV8675207.1 hypothetical protein [Methylomirabilota bacterium]